MSAYGTNKAGDTDFRKKWDKQEYAEKAKKRDLEEKERMQENEELMRQGMVMPPPFYFTDMRDIQERSQDGLRRTTFQSLLS